MLPITVCLISKNESKHIVNCLSRLRPHFREIILTDTGSTDDTIELAKPYADKLLSYQWNNDFSAARNFALSHARNNWVLNVDCDEYLTSIEEALLRKLLDSHPCSVGMVRIINPCVSFGVPSVRTEELGRLFPKSYYQYKGIVHEQPAPIADGSDSFFHAPLTFQHEGYATEEIVKHKAARNLALLEQVMRDSGPDPYLCYQLGQSCLLLKEHERACRYFDLGLSFDVDPRQEYVRSMVESYGYCLLECRQFQTALTFRNIYDTFGDRADFVFLMGLIYMNNAMFPEAIEEFRKAPGLPAATEGVNSYLAWYNAGVICECLGSREEAACYYSKCCGYPPAAARLTLL